MRNTSTKYYNNVFLIDDKNRKEKLQEFFLRSIRNDFKKWTKVIRYKEVNKKIVRDTDYFSPDYNGYVFQLDFDKHIGMVCLPDNKYELIFDYTEYKGKQYPKELNQVFHIIFENVFTDKMKKIDTLIPKTSSEIAEDTRNERSSKLKEIWGGKES